MSDETAASAGPGRVLAIVGPTASGKSEVALQLAQLLDGEIISVDSMQVYRGMDIGTAKPSASERALVAHHLIDIAGINESFDAAQFCNLAWLKVSQIRKNGRVPILCGGTGLYFSAFFHGLGEAPSGSAALRAELQATPLCELLKELAQSDPVAYQRIDQQNPRRVIRAVEVVRLTGKPYSGQRADWRKADQSNPSPYLIFGIAREPEDLRQRIEARVDRMFKAGLVVETEKLLKAGLNTNQTAMQALGYRQVVEHLQGLRSLSETIDLVKLRTRQFAKRQMTWFRRQQVVEWLPLTATSIPDRIAEKFPKDGPGLTRLEDLNRL